MAKLQQQSLIRLRAHRAPAQRDYAPKAHDAGQRIVWEKHTPAHWTEPGQSWHAAPRGEYVPAVSETLTGVIWSAGPLASTVWVLADSGAVAAVRVPSAAHGGMASEILGQPGSIPAPERDAVSESQAA